MGRALEAASQTRRSHTARVGMTNVELVGIDMKTFRRGEYHRCERSSGGRHDASFAALPQALSLRIGAQRQRER